MKTESPVQRYQFQVTRTTDGGGNNGYCTRSTLLGGAQTGGGASTSGGSQRGERYSLTPVSSMRGRRRTWMTERLNSVVHLLD